MKGIEYIYKYTGWSDIIITPYQIMMVAYQKINVILEKSCKNIYQHKYNVKKMNEKYFGNNFNLKRLLYRLLPC